MNIGTICEMWANRTPDAAAIIDTQIGRSVTWSELDQRVRTICVVLNATLALPRASRVAILSRNSVEYFEIFYAATRLGLLIEPLNWRLAAAELSLMVSNSEPSLILYSAEFSDLVSEIRPQVKVDNWFQLGDEWDRLVSSTETNYSLIQPIIAQVSENDPCILLHTGGTTGGSKGVVHTHRSALFGMVNQSMAERNRHDDVYLFTGQLFHISLVVAMSFALNGCPIVLIDFSPRRALEVIETHRVTNFQAFPTMLSWMMDVDDFEKFDLSSLRNVVMGGGTYPTAQLRAAQAAFACSLTGCYGMTEGGTMSVLSPEDHLRALAGTHEGRLASAGREVPLTRMRVTAPDGTDVPKDSKTPGEILVSSPANMAGYWRRPELTEDTVVDGWLRTGDIGVWDAERYIYIVDRAKDIIISGGENIYSVQVEEAIACHPSVLECAVIGVPDPVWGESVKAVVVLKHGTAATAADIIATASRRLGSYQKPRIVEFVDALPKSSTGKLLKRLLRQQDAVPARTNQDERT